MEEETEVLTRKAIGKLRYIGLKRYSKDTLDETVWVFNVFVKNYYGIRQELTKEEMGEKFSRKKTEKDLLELTNEIEHLKYEVKNPSKGEVKKLLSGIIKFIKQKKEEKK